MFKINSRGIKIGGTNRKRSFFIPFSFMIFMVTFLSLYVHYDCYDGHCTRNIRSTIQSSFTNFGSFRKHDNLSTLEKDHFHNDHEEEFSDGDYLASLFGIASVEKFCAPVAPERRLHIKIDIDSLAKLAGGVHVNNRVTLTFASESQLTLLNNWMCSLHALGIRDYLVIAFDRKTYDFVSAKVGHERVFYDAAVLDGKKNNWSAKDNDREDVWRWLMAVKVHITKAIIDSGFDIFITDSDTAFLKNPAVYFPTHPVCDFAFQADRKDVFLLKDYADLTAFNCGVYLAHSNDRTKFVYDVWSKAFNCADGGREQRALHLSLKLLKSRDKVRVFIPEVLNRPDRTKTNLCYLDPKRFPNGGLFFLPENVKKFDKIHGRTSPALLHANYMKGKMEKKISSLKQNKAWFYSEHYKKCRQKASTLA